MKTTLDYYDRIPYTGDSKIVRTEELNYISDIDCFEQFYELNNQLRYCNGCYYEFQDKTINQKYKDWLKSDDYKKKSFNLYYGNGVVD